MKIIIKDDLGNIVMEKEFNEEETSLSLSLENGQVTVEPAEASPTAYIGCYH
ncbi:hypothetical protein [Clostridium aminobutyricum]|uniref:Uncharacterized protein n=1 Tax=Clostridium aminobutyricum TaxID=33953 RepID=A0A939D887_CLOAM|nr:hypothetical protein [Clostridium aminobutyricum]MBN7773042.1 hypothetical protein [Clostridium aminobutyricum]